MGISTTLRNKPLNIRDLMSNKEILKNLDETTYPDIECAGKVMFMKPVKFTTKTIDSFNKEYVKTMFVLFDRNMNPLIGYNDENVNFTDKCILGAFIQYNAPNTGVGRMSDLLAVSKSPVPDFLYIVPLNEIMFESSVVYNTIDLENDPHGRDMFIEQLKIRTVDPNYWTRGNLTELDAIGKENQEWYAKNEYKIANIVSDLTDPSSWIRIILGSM